MFQTTKNEEELFDALRHLKHNKHEVILFHTYDEQTELNFNFDNTPKKFVDVETGQEINLYAENAKEKYEKLVADFFYRLKNKCLQYNITYVSVNINEGYDKVLTSYLISRKNFL